MNRNNQIKLLISLVLFGFAVFFFSQAMQTYQVLTSSRAAGGSFAQCNADGSNQPCGSCNITDITMNSNGQGTVTYGCQLLCDQIDSASCPMGTYQINDSSWFWCNGSSGPSCTQASSDVKGNQHNTSTISTFTLSETNKNETKNGLTWDFTINGWNNCGRIQADVQINAPGINVAGLTKSFGSDCESPQPTPQPTTPPEQPTNTPQPTTPPGEPTNTPVPTDVPTNTPTTPPDEPTNTPVPTETPTIIPTDTPEPTATETPIPTDTPVPTATFTPVPTFTLAPTFTPQPTYPPQPTYTPQPTAVAQILPTATPITQLVVNDQPPGMTPWMLVLVPIGLILIGLFL